MLVRRLLLLAAVLLVLAALAAGLAPPPTNDSAQLERTDLPAGATLTERIKAVPGANTPVTVKRGDNLQLEVSGDFLDSVLIEGLDQIEAIEPTTPARFELLIDTAPGVYPIRLVDADRRIGQLNVTE